MVVNLSQSQWKYFMILTKAVLESLEQVDQYSVFKNFSLGLELFFMSIDRLKDVCLTKQIKDWQKKFK